MRVEACCQSLLAEILPEIDPKREGFCIDVGVGTFAFYCEIFAKLGYPTVAVEPVPIKKLRKLCDRYPIELVEVCLSDINGKQKLYLGNFAGLFNHNFNSLSPDWFGSSQKSKEVFSLTLPTLLDKVNANQITCLKLDIEGWEFNVIKQFTELPNHLLPKVVMFEYGGGVNKTQGKKGWSKDFLEKTLNCLSILQSCGYGSSLLVDFAPGSQEKFFNLRSLNLTEEQLFTDQSVYGNIISLRDCEISEDKVHQICQSYTDSSLIDLVVNAIVSR